MTSSGSGGSLLDNLEDKTSTKRVQKSSNVAEIDRRMVFTALLALFSIGVLGYVIVSTYRSYANDPKRQAIYSVVADSETGEVDEKFPLPSDGKGYPAVNPKTGKRTLYPVEECYWTKDGKAKLKPTYVILNSWFGKKTPTICPDCGRTVTKSNRMPPDALMQAAWDAEQRAK